MIQYYGSQGAIYVAEKAFYITGMNTAMLVTQPASWSRVDEKAFIELMTGLDFGMITELFAVFSIKGDAIIIQPSVEVREMGNFVPLLIKCVMPSDRNRIEKFFKEHPLVGTNDAPIN